MFKHVSISCAALGSWIVVSAGCTPMVEAVKHPTVYLVPRNDAVMVLLEPIKRVKFELVAQDTLIRTKGDIDAGAVFYYPSAPELRELLKR